MPKKIKKETKSNSTSKIDIKNVASENEAIATSPKAKSNSWLSQTKAFYVKHKKQILIGTAIGIPLVATSITVPVVLLNKSQLSYIGPNSTRNQVKEVMENIVSGKVDSYTLNDKTYSVSGSDYAKNIVPLVEWIKTYYPSLLTYADGSAPDPSTKDIGMHKLTDLNQFKNPVMEIEPNSHFQDIAMPELPEGYFWEFSCDEIYMRTSPDGSKVSYWTKALRHFQLPTDVTPGKVFTFKARINCDYGLKVLDNQEQEFTVKVN